MKAVDPTHIVTISVLILAQSEMEENINNITKLPTKINNKESLIYCKQEFINFLFNLYSNQKRL